MNKLFILFAYFVVLPIYKLALALRGDRRRKLQWHDGPSYWIAD